MISDGNRMSFVTVQRKLFGKKDLRFYVKKKTRMYISMKTRLKVFLTLKITLTKFEKSASVVYM